MQSNMQIAQTSLPELVQSAAQHTNYQKTKKTSKKVLTKGDESGIIYKLSRRAQRKAVSKAVSEAAARSLKIEQQTKKYKLDSE